MPYWEILVSVHTITTHYNSGSHLPACFLSLHVEMALHSYFLNGKKGTGLCQHYLYLEMCMRLWHSHVCMPNI